MTRIAIVGASGNVGTAVLSRLASADDVSDVIGIARRVPPLTAPPYDGARWVSCDISSDNARAELADAFADADVVVHLAWQIQPSHDEKQLRRTNVLGSMAVFDTAAQAGVGHIVYASSVGTYAPGPKDPPVDESWPATGVSSSSYARHKAAVETWLDGWEARHPDVVVTRMRPGLAFQRQAASQIARYFLGPFAPVSWLGRVSLPLVPLSRRLVFQAVHADDLAQAYLLAIRARLPGPINVAADPVLGPADLAAAIRAKRVLPIPLRLLRGVASVTWHLRLQPTSPGWVDLAGSLPIMDTSRATTELGWKPRMSSSQALAELVAGMADRAGTPSPPMTPGKRRTFRLSSAR
jgi:UDP-glucose 4-epimerase